MIYIDTHSADVFFNFGCEYYFAVEKPLPGDVFLMWKTTPTLMIGKYQNTLEEIDGAYAREKGLTVVRRLSGGGTIYTDEGGWQFTCITRSLGMEIEFDRFIAPMVELLRSLGLDAAATGRNDITVNGKKVSGNAQFRLGSATVHHGSLLFDTNLEELARATTPQPYKITSKAIHSVRDRVTNIRDALPAEKKLTAEEFRALAVRRLTDSVYELTEEDTARIREIGRERFADPEILYAAAPKFEIEKTIHLPGGTFVVGLTVRRGKIESAGITGDFFSASDSLGSDLGGALIGCGYTPDAVRTALEPFAGQLYRVELGELVRGMFE